MNSLNTTDIDREFKDYNDDPEQFWDVILLAAVTTFTVIIAFVSICTALARNGFWDNI